MCFANATLAVANLRDNLYIQPVIKKHCYAWMTSSKVHGGYGKVPVSKCGVALIGGRQCFAEWARQTHAERDRTHFISCDLNSLI